MEKFVFNEQKLCQNYLYAIYFYSKIEKTRCHPSALFELWIFSEMCHLFVSCPYYRRRYLRCWQCWNSVVDFICCH